MHFPQKVYRLRKLNSLIIVRTRGDKNKIFRTYVASDHECFDFCHTIILNAAQIRPDEKPKKPDIHQHWKNHFQTLAKCFGNCQNDSNKN